MLFNSQIFIIFFLPSVLIAYYVVAENRAFRQAVIVVSSLIFYAYWNVAFLPLLVGATLTNWLLVQGYAATKARALLLAGIALNLGLLGLFKYADFIGGNVAHLFGIPFQPWDLVLPLGISFFVFQKIAYLMDLRRGDRHIYGFLDFCTFVTFFPQLIAGPIVRHGEIIPQLAANPRRPDMWESLARGGVLFTLGLAKKIALADFAAAVCNPLFERSAGGVDLNLAEAWTAAGAFTLQIYFDFSGYSDMAIGAARMFGLRLPFNFDAPYRSCSIREFWRRWHMTLSRLLRDYLYIPLGGNRGGPWLQARNVVLTMLLGGLWHGAGWTFVVWGGLNGIALALNSAWSRLGLAMPRWAGWPITLIFVMACWVVFRSPDFGTAASILKSMIGLNGAGSVQLDSRGDHRSAILLGLAVLCALVGPTSQSLALDRLRPQLWVALATASAIILALLQIGGAIPNEFIYFQF